MNNIVLFIFNVILFGVAQTKCLGKKNPLIKYLPVGMSAAALLLCLITYIGVFDAILPSTENKDFVIYLLIPYGGAFIGCLSGLLLSKFLNSYQL